MALPLKYNIRNIVVRKGSTLATAFTIGLTVAVFLMVMALARGIDMTLSSSGEQGNMIVLREGSTAELNSSVTRENFNDLMYLDGVERENELRRERERSQLRSPRRYPAPERPYAHAGIASSLLRARAEFDSGDAIASLNQSRFFHSEISRLL